MNRYQDFLASKLAKPRPAGFEIANPERRWKKLFPWQRKIVAWALRLGRAALFADCGLGKTAMQLTWAKEVARHTGKPVLILSPLAVATQTLGEGKKFGIQVTICRSQASVAKGVNVTNYQKLLSSDGIGLSDQWDLSDFAGVVLDESSILKSFTGKTKQVLCSAFVDTPFRLACTATPAPNDHLELGNHSQFLGIMDSDEMISRWFINDTSEAGKYRLKKHAAKDYWRWVASWAVCLGKPSDLGYADDGFCLPPLKYHQHVVDGNATADAPEGYLFRCDSLTATTLHAEMRKTASARAARVAALVNASPEAWVVWCNTNYEADELVKVIPDAVEVRGSDSEYDKEEKLSLFATGQRRVIISKPSICGFGLNWQHCHNVAFVGLSYSHEQFYQAVRRSWRFGQKEDVHCHVVIADTEGEVLAAIHRKEVALAEMRREMVAATREAVLEQAQKRSLSMVEHKQASGNGWIMHHGDCVEVVRSIERDSIDLTVFSPPFSSLYIYSDALADMGNSASDEEFFQHFGYLVPELYRVTVPGRCCVVHCKDLPKYAGRDGAAGLKDFPGQCVRLFEEHGWTFHSRVTIWKCPITEMTRTKNSGLLYKNLRADSTMSRQGMADYLLVFRKWTEGMGLMGPKPVSHTYKTFPLERWQQWASPVWMDIDQMDTLNYRLAKEGQDEKHICPLQLEVIRRAVLLWSNPGDLVLSPFAGIGSEGYVSILEGRRFVGVELKEGYWQWACKHLEQACDEVKQRSRSLFQDGEIFDQAIPEDCAA